MVDYRETFFNVLKKDVQFSDFLTRYNFNNDNKEEEKEKPEINLPTIKKSRQKSDSMIQITSSHEMKTSMDLRNTLTHQNIKMGSTHIPSLNLQRNKSRKPTNLMISPIKLQSVIKNDPFSNSPKKLTKVSSMFDLKKSFSPGPEQKKASMVKQDENRKKSPGKETLTQFLNIKQIEKVEIKNQKLKHILDEAGGLGPYYSKCGTCNNKNLSFYKDMNFDNAAKILGYIKRKSGMTN